MVTDTTTTLENARDEHIGNEIRTSHV